MCLEDLYVQAEFRSKHATVDEAPCLTRNPLIKAFALQPPHDLGKIVSWHDK
jgi:hypothetical protein